jgi:iron(III) transport system ATP-binding protein/spermidine/putrescine transport system ATP-binding protein
VSDPEIHIRLSHVWKRFGDEAAVKDVSLEVPRGSFTTLLGPSGCGKTTTLRLIAGFYEADEGDIYIGDRRVNDVPVHKRRTAMVFQDYALFPHMTVADNVSYGLRLARLPKPQIREKTDATLAFLGLTGREKRYPSQLSGGQQQRVALARALVMSPEALLLDEPLSNLDAKLRVSIRAELIGIQRQLGITTIYVTHDQEEALAMSDWMAVMSAGEVVQWGRPWDLYYHPSTAFLADFLGSVNLVRAPVVEARNGRLRIRLPGAVTGSGDVDVASAGGTAGTEALLCIRPETLRLVDRDQEQLLPEAVVLAGEVRTRTFLGQLMRYTVRIAGQDWLVDQPDPGGAVVLDGSVRVAVNPLRIHVIRAGGSAPPETELIDGVASERGGGATHLPSRA